MKLFKNHFLEHPNIVVILLLFLVSTVNSQCSTPLCFGVPADPGTGINLSQIPEIIARLQQQINSLTTDLNNLVVRQQQQTNSLTTDINNLKQQISQLQVSSGTPTGDGSGNQLKEDVLQLYCDAKSLIGIPGITWLLPSPMGTIVILQGSTK